MSALEQKRMEISNLDCCRNSGSKTQLEGQGDTGSRTTHMGPLAHVLWIWDKSRNKARWYYNR
eukprot:1161175-Pelagomonas_calceolata.AAC.1